MAKEATDTASALMVKLVDLMHECPPREPPGGAENLSPGSIRILLHLHASPGAGIRELAERTGLSKPSVSLRVKEFESVGLCRRRTDSTDGRAIHLFLTERGTELAEALRRFRREKAASLLSVLTDDERGTVATAAETILKRWRNG